MATVTSSASATLVSMLSAVNTTANAVTRSVHTVASSLDMLDQYVQDARAAQIAASRANRSTILSNLRAETARDTAKRHAELQRELAADPIFAKLFKDEYDRFETEVAPLIKADLAAFDNRLIIG